MAPSSGHMLVPKFLTIFKYAVSKTASAVRARLGQASSSSTPATHAVLLQPIPISTRHALHPIAALRQSRSSQQCRFFSTRVKRLVSTKRLSSATSTATAGRTSLPISRTSRAILRAPVAPFASPLRPNLTGGALPRSAGGYGLGGNGTRAFSHVPSAQAHVVQNVSAALRAFTLNGYKARYDGIDGRTGGRKYVAVGRVQHDAQQTMQRAAEGAEVRGTTLEFTIAPTITAISPLNAQSASSTQTAVDALDAEMLDPLASDFARAISTLSAVHADLTRLSVLGTLPIAHPAPHVIAVRFPGCDGSIVEALCDELGVSRGVVREDPAWRDDKDVQMALLFPCAPSGDASDDGIEHGIEHYFEQGRDIRPSSLDEALAWQCVTPRSLLPESSTLPEDEVLFPPLEAPRHSLSSSSDSCYCGSGHSARINGRHGEHGMLEHVSAPRSDVSWQPNPWAGLERERATAKGSGVSRGEPSSSSSSAYDVQAIYRYLAECDGRMRK